MNAAPRSLRATHRVRLVAALGALAFVMAGATACAQPGASAGQAHACSDKVVKSVTTNTPVAGLWNCLTAKFQDTLRQYADAGMVNSADDAVFTAPGAGTPSVLASHYVGRSNGVDVYAVLVQTKSGPVTVSFTVWVAASSNKVENVAIGSPLF